MTDDVITSSLSYFYYLTGANPHKLIRTERAKTIHVKMLLNRKNKQKRTKSMADAEEQIIENGSTKTLDTSLPLPYKRKGLSESEKLIRDTLLHESKTMKPEKTSLNKINGIFECYENSLKNKNGVIKRNSEFVPCLISKGYMTITLNNIRRHNVLSVDVSLPLVFLEHENIDSRRLFSCQNVIVSVHFLEWKCTRFCFGIFTKERA